MKKYITIALLALLCLCVLFVFSACKKEDGSAETTENNGVSGTQAPTTIDQFTVFDGTAYSGKIIYSKVNESLAQAMVNGMKEQFGVKPEIELQTQSDADSSTLELLLGDTNRSESAQISNVDANDAWYFVGLIGNKLVINGSNNYMLQLAVDYFLSDYITTEQNVAFTATPVQDKQVIWDDYSAEGWALHELPYYKGSNPNYSTTVYESGKLLTDYDSQSAKESKGITINRTSKEEFLDYVERLKSFGYEQTAYETIDKNVYVTLTNGVHQVYTYLTVNKRTVNLILDPSSDTVDEISTPMTEEEIATAQAMGNSAVFYQYGLNQEGGFYAESGVSGAVNNGMMYIIKCADNSVIIIDGGDSEQTDYATLNSFLHEITNTADGEKVTIASWVLTHLHSDHYQGFLKFLSGYHDQVDLKSICANVPYDIACEKQGSAVEVIKTYASLLNTWYPECKELQIHTGQRLQFADVTLQALYTQEDCMTVGTSGNTLRNADFNDTSVVYKITAEDMSMMILGDAVETSETYMITVYDEETLKCDIVQVAHHAHNGVKEIYGYIQAEIYLIPQSYGGFQVRDYDWQVEIRSELLEGKIFPTYAQGYGTEEEMIFYSGKAALTVGLQVVDGKITVVDAPDGAINREPPEESTEGEDTETQWGDIDFLDIA